MKEITGQQLLDFLNEKGWKEGYQNLKELHESLEWKQANLYADPSTVTKASKMSHMLLKQDETLLLIEREARKRGIDIGKHHCGREK